MQGTWVRALVREDPTCRGVTKPMCHSYWACVPRARAPQREATAMRSPCTATKSSPRLLQLEKDRAQQQRPNAAKNKLIKYIYIYTLHMWLKPMLRPVPHLSSWRRLLSFSYPICILTIYPAILLNTSFFSLPVDFLEFFMLIIMSSAHKTATFFFHCNFYSFYFFFLSLLAKTRSAMLNGISNSR